jgi:DHA3 family macrolide efflux protein-like MFS transporter
MKKFTTVLFLIIISLIGTSMTSFSLGIWMLKSSDSTFYYAVIGFLTIFPQILFSPFIGSLIDRFDKKKIIIIGQIVAALGSFVMIILYHLDLLKIEYILLITFLGSVANGFVSKAFYVSTASLVKKEDIGRAKGIESTAYALTTITVPIVAPLIYTIIDLSGVFLIDVISFLVSILGLLYLNFNIKKVDKEQVSYKKDVRVVLQFLKSKKGLQQLIIFYAWISLVLGGLGILTTPMILGFSNETGLGIAMTFAGVGGALGGIIMSIYKNVKLPIKNVVLLLHLLGFILMLFIIIPINIISVGILLFSFAFITAIMMVNDHIFWQNIVPYEIQGRVFGYKDLVIKIWTPISYLIMSIIIDNLAKLIVKNVPINRNYYPGSDRTFSILVIFSFIGFIILVVSYFIKYKKKFADLDVLFAEKRNHD